MACSLDLDDIIASSPPELAPYVSSNNILPSYLSSYLDAYLLKLFQTMKRLESEITASPLEELPIFKMQDYQKVKEAYNTHVRIKAPIRRIPQDVLGVIFPYAIDIPPFNTYSDVARIRSVCSSWRHVARTTPGLWTSLTIHLDKWCGEELDDLDSDALLRHFKEALAPWTSILSKTIPYQLILTSNKRKRKSHWPVYNQISHRNLLVEYLFHSTPGPNIVTIDSWSALCGALASHSSSTRTVKVHTIGLWEQPDIRLDIAFPNLEILTSDGSFDCVSLSMGHPSLAILHLDHVETTAQSFTDMMRKLPTLRELKLASRTELDLEDTPPDSPDIYSHPSLQVLLVQGEDVLMLCRYMTFPALRFFTLEAIDMWTDPILSDEILPRILESSLSKAFTVSLRGMFHRYLLEQTIHNLPPNTFLHLAVSPVNNQDSPSTSQKIALQSDNIEEIYCDTDTGNLSWVVDGPARRISSRPLTIHVPTVSGGARIKQKRREELLRAGYRIEQRTTEEINASLRALAPEYRPESPWTWMGLLG